MDLHEEPRQRGCQIILSANAATDRLSSVVPPIQLFRGDHLDVLPMLPRGGVDCVVTSPNYNLGVAYGGNPENDRLALPAYKQYLTSLFAGCKHVVREGGVLAVVVPPAINFRQDDGQRLFFTADFVRAQLQVQGWLLRESIVIGKSARDDEPQPFARGGIKGTADDPRFRFCHEVVVLASNGAYSHGARAAWEDKPVLKEFLKDLWWLHPASVAGLRMAQPFRAEMVRRLMVTFTGAGELVLDPCAGTGVVGRVSWELGRGAILIEREPQYWPRLERLVRRARQFARPWPNRPTRLPARAFRVGLEA